MSEKKDQEISDKEAKKAANEMGFSMGKLRAKSWTLAGVSSAISLLVFAGGGFLLDYTLDKWPVFFIIGMVVSFIATNVIIMILGKKVWTQSA